MTKIFIDGSAGTTGLQIYDRIASREDLALITLPEELRKDPDARREALAGADIAFLCLPDEAARESAALAAGSGVRLIDTSTAHRTDPDWVYGFPELTGRGAVANAKRVANPGCHASGFIALAAPLVRAGLLPADTALTAFSLTGYSGGGKKMIAQYEDPGRSPLLDAPRQYGLTQNHKHLPEMRSVCGLTAPPVFCPIVSDYYSGMEVTIPLAASQLRGTAEDLLAVYESVYTGSVVQVNRDPGEGGFLSAGALAGSDRMEISVLGGEERVLLVSRFDNLGKGASGAAVQNMNLMLGLPETTGLNL